MISLAHTGFAWLDRTGPSAVFDGRSGRTCPLASNPAVVSGVAYGYDVDGALVRVDPKGGVGGLLAADGLPKGARRGELSAARDVLYLGNWAIETGSGRVLWRLPDLRPETPAIPVGDHRFVVGLEFGRLRALTDRAEGARETAAPEPAPAEAEAVSDAELRESGPATACYRLLDPIEEALLAELDGIFRTYARTGLIAELGRILDLAREHGLDEERLREWTGIRTGAREKYVPDQRRVALRETEDRLRNRIGARLVAAGDRLSGLGMKDAATVLYAEAGDLAPDTIARQRERIAALVPPAFPFEGPDRPDRWAVWARHLLPADGRFLPGDGPAWKHLTGEWRSKAIGLATKSVLLFSRARDPEIVAGCLRNGEGVVHALETFFGASGGDRLEVHLYASREEFVSEKGAAEGAREFLAGFYSPVEGVSRFFVPRDGDTGEVLGRDLFAVMNHELTHHYLDLRWARGSKTDSGAPWAEEGIARFIEDQTVEMSRRELRFDDDTAPSVDATVHLRRDGLLFPTATLLGTSSSDFWKLDVTPKFPIALRNTARSYLLSRMNIFYEQSGALVFFLLNRAGEGQRKAFVDYLRRVYAGDAKAATAKDLGFDDLAALDRAFAAFLEEVGKR